MRGTEEQSEVVAREVRFIPAHAGNSSMRPRRGIRPAVHPRACGEQAASMRRVASSDGSSPRMRGTVWNQTDRTENGRFIPAHAGNSRAIPPYRPRKAVHPRACGEQLCEAEERIRKAGSSPRMRGTEVVAAFADLVSRFIPAHAGNSPLRPLSRRPMAVHPRACGEQRERVGRSTLYCGSSPRMRGTAGWQGAPPWPCRFIPAHAGNSARS